MADNDEFAGIVERHYEPLYRFAYSLTRSEADAGDLTQHAFQVYAQKRDRLRDATRAKSWLFTILHRKFLERCRRETRFHHHELDEAANEVPAIQPPEFSGVDTEQVVAALATLDEVFRAPVALFYLEDHSYPEIAAILEVPLGTVKSRISRGVRQLQALFGAETRAKEPSRE
jgi:RNA polymerase sigma-70 factor (ECF subfamily)